MRDPSSPRPTPALRRHKPSSRAVVTLDGKDHYLGPWPVGKKRPAPEFQQAYDRLISEWLANGRRLHPDEDPEADLLINELALAFWRHAEQHYRRADGTPTNELNDWKLSLRPLKALYGTLPAVEFGPLKLEAVRQRMLDASRYRVRFQLDGQVLERWVREDAFRRVPESGQCQVLWKKKWLAAELLSQEKALCRGVINQRIRRLVRLFKWGVSKELVPERTWQALTTVRGLEEGRSSARETEAVGPVPEADVYAVLPFALPPVRAMAELQLLTGMRPGEACAMRGCDLDMTGEVWLYRPAHHKTRHKGKDRVIAIGPKAQAIIKPFLKVNIQANLFSPREAVEWRRQRAREKRKTKVQPSQVCRKRKKPKRQASEAYTNRAYSMAMARAIVAANTAAACSTCKPRKPAERCPQCQAAAIAHFHPHQLRHTYATEVRRRFGLESAQVALGHAQAAVTEIYAERDLTLASKVAREIG